MVQQPVMMVQQPVYAQPVMVVQQQPQIIVVQQQMAAAPAAPKEEEKRYKARGTDPKYDGCDCFFCSGADLTHGCCGINKPGCCSASKEGQFEGEDRSKYGEFKTDICGACCADPVSCMCGATCLCCQNYLIRKRALDNNLENYKCFAGYLALGDTCDFVCCKGCCTDGKGDQLPCPTCALCCEVWCCAPQALAASRLLIMDQYKIGKNASCDNRLIKLNNFCLCVASLLECLEWPLNCCCKPWCTCFGLCKWWWCTPATCCRFVSDCYWCCLSGCMVSQLVTQQNNAGEAPAMMCGSAPKQQSMQ